VVYAASSSAYGGLAKLAENGIDAGKTDLAYGVTKLVGEIYSQVFTQVYGSRR